MTQNDEILREDRGGVVFVTLNRPAVLNALSLGMIREIRRILAETRDDPTVRAIVFCGAGDKAFCAGGDIKAVYHAGVGQTDPAARSALAREYFADEYRMNRELYDYPKPLIAMMDGITMGGGFGVAGPCSIRIATERTVFAMPEVGIGFFPDVGSMYSLTRAPGRMGQWLALTGDRITGTGMCAAGLATHFIMAEQVPAILAGDFGFEISKIIDSFNVPDDFKTETYETTKIVIEKCFYHKRVESILDALDEDGGNFASQTAATIRAKSPTSVKLAHAYYLWAEGKTFHQVTAMDYRLSIRCVLGHEFYEGVRAAVVDKDRNPRWNPARIEDVPDDVIASYFGDDLPDLDGV